MWEAHKSLKYIPISDPETTVWVTLAYKITVLLINIIHHLEDEVYYSKPNTALYFFGREIARVLHYCLKYLGKRDNS